MNDYYKRVQYNMPSYMFYMNAYLSEKFEKIYKLHGIKIPMKYGEKALLCDTTCEFQEFYECILDYIKTANIAEKTMLKYEHYFHSQESNILCFWHGIKNMI